MFPPTGLPDPSAGASPVAMPPGPGHAVIEGLGTGTPIGPLRPSPLRSVAPSGMLTLPKEVVAEAVIAPDPGTDDCPDIVGNPCATDPQPTISPGLTSGEVVPPASNVLLGLAGLGTNGKIAHPVRAGHSTGPAAAGLSPPVKSSVGASGTPHLRVAWAGRQQHDRRNDCKQSFHRKLPRRRAATNISLSDDCASNYKHRMLAAGCLFRIAAVLTCLPRSLPEPRQDLGVKLFALASAHAAYSQTSGR
jgi:hypothetical protein